MHRPDAIRTQPNSVSLLHRCENRRRRNERQIKSNYEFDFLGAEREFVRAIVLSPNYASAHQWRTENLSLQGRFDEALAESKRALELDPLSLIINRIYVDVLLDMRRSDEAIEQYRKTLEIDPNFRTAAVFMGRAYPFVKTSFEFDALRSDSRYPELLKRTGIP